ncbi:hypothetical protein E2P63_01480 [Candidatus Bathyarchaeota archaeon]|nr:hypothetical protein E2P63_01480 [Candidatus Bathyarchaeota archaeon]
MDTCAFCPDRLVKDGNDYCKKLTPLEISILTSKPDAESDKSKVDWGKKPEPIIPPLEGKINDDSLLPSKCPSFKNKPPSEEEF